MQDHSLLLQSSGYPVTDPVIVFAIVLFVIFMAPILLHRLRMPGIIGLILAGAALGPNGFHVLERSTAIELFGTVGLLYIMFQAGLEIDLNEFKKNREKMKVTDEHISDFYRNHRKAFLGVFLLYSLLIILWTTEIHLTLIFIGATNISFLDSFLITVLGQLAFLFPLTPGSLGIYEATYVALFALLGKGTALGFTLVLIRRVIALIWAGFGLIGMLKSKPVKKN